MRAPVQLFPRPSFLAIAQKKNKKQKKPIRKIYNDATTECPVTLTSYLQYLWWRSPHPPGMTAAPTARRERRVILGQKLQHEDLESVHVFGYRQLNKERRSCREQPPSQTQTHISSQQRRFRRVSFPGNGRQGQ